MMEIIYPKSKEELIQGKFVELNGGLARICHTDKGGKIHFTQKVIAKGEYLVAKYAIPEENIKLELGSVSGTPDIFYYLVPSDKNYDEEIKRLENAYQDKIISKRMSMILAKGTLTSKEDRIDQTF